MAFLSSYLKIDVSALYLVCSVMTSKRSPSFKGNKLLAKPDTIDMNMHNSANFHLLRVYLKNWR